MNDNCNEKMCMPCKPHLIVIAFAICLTSLAIRAESPPDFGGTWSGVVNANYDEEFDVEDFTCFAGCPIASYAYYQTLLDNAASDDRPYAEIRRELTRAMSKHMMNEFVSRLTEEGKRLREAFPPSKDPVLGCKPIGLVKQVASPLPLRITQKTDHVLMEYEQWASVRTIHMDGRRHPKNPALTRLGYSTGRYEGDSLVIETVGVEPAVFWPHIAGGGAHSDQLTATERYTRSADGKWLTLEFTVEDPVVFREPYTFVRRWLFTPGETIAEEGECIGVAGQP